VSACLRHVCFACSSWLLRLYEQQPCTLWVQGAHRKLHKLTIAIASHILCVCCHRDCEATSCGDARGCCSRVQSLGHVSSSALAAGPNQVLSHSGSGGTPWLPATYRRQVQHPHLVHVCTHLCQRANELAGAGVSRCAVIGIVVVVTNSLLLGVCVQATPWAGAQLLC
jgi:hypothetical protein